jgi:hypothetical protein
MDKPSRNLIIFIGLCVLAFLMLITLIFQNRERPETEMQSLLKIEQSLSLPPEQSRREESRDGDTDWKGARHYDKRVVLEYSSSADSELALQRVQEAQYWKLERKSGDPASTAGDYTFINRTQRACMHLAINEEPLIKNQFGDILTNYIVLMGASDRGCRSNFAQASD